MTPTSDKAEPRRAGTCAKCGAEKQFYRKGLYKDGTARLQPVCLPCGAAYLREYKNRHGGPYAYKLAQKAKYPEKHRARKLVEQAVDSGALVRKPCERCGSAKSQAHHEDYSQPLDVMWLCPKHHKDRHREIDLQRSEKHAA